MKAPYSSAMLFMPNQHFIPLFLLMAPQFSFGGTLPLFLFQGPYPMTPAGLKTHSGPVRTLRPQGLRIGLEMGS